MRYDRLFTKLFCSPLLLEASVRAGFERVLLAYMQGQPADLRGALPEKIRAQKADAESVEYYKEQILEIQGATAIIHIDGPIDKHLSFFERLCFTACDLNDVDAALAQVTADANILNVLLQINSPGGVVGGVPETAQRIAELAQQKNVFAFTDGLCCSAAYWLASQADQIFATPSSMVGSIGVYMALIDESQRLADMGVLVETIKSGDLKAAGASWKPLTDDERVYFQNLCDEINHMFRTAVLSKRPDVAVSAMQGQAHLGATALNEQLVDALVSDRAEALSQF